MSNICAYFEKQKYFIICFIYIFSEKNNLQTMLLQIQILEFVNYKKRVLRWLLSIMREDIFTQIIFMQRKKHPRNQ